jgi:hypothetical protein
VAPVRARAVTTEYQVLIDADNNASTGCTMSTPTGLHSCHHRSIACPFRRSRGTNLGWQIDFRAQCASAEKRDVGPQSPTAIRFKFTKRGDNLLLISRHQKGHDVAKRAMAVFSDFDDEGVAQLVEHALKPHIWWGVSVENRKHGLPRIEALQKAPAAVRFQSIEPLLEDLGVIVWRESIG